MKKYLCLLIIFLSLLSSACQSRLRISIINDSSDELTIEYENNTIIMPPNTVTTIKSPNDKILSIKCGPEHYHFQMPFGPYIWIDYEYYDARYAIANLRIKSVMGIQFIAQAGAKRNEPLSIRGEKVNRQ
jgi:hypothetical protein